MLESFRAPESNTDPRPRLIPPNIFSHFSAIFRDLRALIKGVVHSPHIECASINRRGIKIKGEERH